MIFQCNCKHEYQDKVNGKGKRIFNELKKEASMFRCTVCQRQQSGK